MSGLRVKSSTARAATLGGLTTQTNNIPRRASPRLNVDLTPPARSQRNDQLNVQVPSTKRGSIIASKGICVMRPEIILAMRMQPAYVGDTGFITTPVGKMLAIQMSARDIRAENIDSFVQQLRADSVAADIIEQLLSAFTNQLSGAELDIGFLVNTFAAFDAVTAVFSMKDHVRELRDGMTQFIDRRQSTLYDIEELFVDHMGFTRDGFRTFTDTKLIKQLLFDLGNAVRRYTPELFGIVDPDRQGDTDPFTIDRTTSFTGGRFTFDVANFGSTNVVRNAFDVNIFNRFIDSLPRERNDRMKLLAVTMSRVLAASSALGSRSIQAELRRLNITVSDHDPINDMLGVPGASIIDESNIPGSLDILTRFVDNDQDVVLPFERRFIVGDARSYIPGDDYFFDGLTADPEKLNPQRMIDFARSTTATISSTMNVLEMFSHVDSNYVRTLFGARSVLTGTSIYVAMLNAVGELLSSTRANDTKLRNLMFVIATFNVAQTDRHVRHLLFQLMFIAVVYEDLHRPTSQQIELVDTISNNEVKTYGDLPALRGYVGQVVSGDVIAEVDVGASSTKTGIAVVETAYRHVQQLVIDAVFDVLISGVNGVAGNLSNSVNATHMNAASSSILKFERPTGGKLLDDDFRNVLLRIARVVDKFDDAAARGTAVGDVRHRVHQLRDGTTNYMKLSASVRFMMGFELGAIALGSYNLATFVGVEQGDIVSIRFDRSRFNTMQSVASRMNVTKMSIGKDAMTSQREGRNEPHVKQTAQIAAQYGAVDVIFEDELSREFELVKLALGRDLDVVRSMILTLRAFSSALDKATAKAKLFFSTPARASAPSVFSPASGSNKQRTPRRSLINAQYVYDAKTAADQAERHARHAMMTRQQVGLAHVRLQDVKHALSSDALFNDESQVSRDVKNALWSMLSENTLRGVDGADTRVLSIGIPAGFARSLEGADYFNVSNAQGYVDRELDVVNVDVHRRDCVDDNIVFLPKQFTFELSRFVSSTSFNNIPGSAEIPARFDKVIENVTMTDVSAFNDLSKQEQTLTTVIASDRYRFMTREDRIMMIKNHVTSYLLSVYTRMLTGLDCREDAFLIEPDAVKDQADTATSTAFAKLAERVVIMGGGRSVADLRSTYPEFDDMLTAIEEGELQPGIIQQAVVYDRSSLTKGNAIVSGNLVDLAKLGSSRSMLTAGERLRRTITSPKLFERVFHVAVDPYSFEVDLDRTASTAMGRLALEQAITAGRITNVDGRLMTRRPTSNSTTEVLQYFVVLSQYAEVARQVGNTSSRPTRATKRLRPPRKTRQQTPARKAK